MPRKIVICVDDSECATTAAKWACSTIATRTDDEIQLIAVQALITAGNPAVGPMAASPGLATGLAISYSQQLKEEQDRTHNILKGLKSELSKQFPHLSQGKLSAHSLPAAGGASNAGESICAWVNKEHPDLVVAGSRGMGGLKSTLMSIVGLGSVSSYLLHNLKVPVCIVHGQQLEERMQNKEKKVAVSVDDSECAEYALKWAITNVFDGETRGDQLHLMSVALPVPYVAGVQASALSSAVSEVEEQPPAGDFEAEYRGAMTRANEIVHTRVHKAIDTYKIAADDAAAAHVLDTEENEETMKDCRDYAKEIVQEAVDKAAAAQIPKERIYFKALEPEGGASSVGDSIKHYCAANDIDVLVLGSRGMGAMKRAFLGLVGLGSVSDWCASNVTTCPVIIVKGGEVTGDGEKAGDKEIKVGPSAEKAHKE